MNAASSFPPHRIIIAVDGSAHALAAARLVGDLRLPAGSEVFALAVLTPRHTPGRAALMRALDEVQAALLGRGLKVKTGLLHGHPAEQLAAFADEHPANLMVMGAQGLRATLGILLGGVAQQLVEYAAWPVLVVRAPYGGLQRALVVTDGSAHSGCMLEHLARLPLPKGCEVHALHVLPPPPEPDILAQPWPGDREWIPPLPVKEAEAAAAQQAAAEEQAGQAILRATVDALRPTGLEPRCTLARGDAATEILAYARAHDIDLIVAGSRGLSRVRGWLLGSVSRKLVHYARCSVLIVKDTPEPDGD